MHVLAYLLYGKIFKVFKIFFFPFWRRCRHHILWNIVNKRIVVRILINYLAFRTFCIHIVVKVALSQWNCIVSWVYMWTYETHRDLLNTSSISSLSQSSEMSSSSSRFFFWIRCDICLQSLLSFCLSSVLRNFKNFIDIRKKKNPKLMLCARLSPQFYWKYA